MAVPASKREERVGIIVRFLAEWLRQSEFAAMAKPKGFPLDPSEPRLVCVKEGLIKALNKAYDGWTWPGGWNGNVEVDSVARALAFNLSGLCGETGMRMYWEGNLHAFTSDVRFAIDPDDPARRPTMLDNIEQVRSDLR